MRAHCVSGGVEASDCAGMCSQWSRVVPPSLHFGVPLRAIFAPVDGLFFFKKILR